MVKGDCTLTDEPRKLSSAICARAWLGRAARPRGTTKVQRRTTDGSGALGRSAGVRVTAGAVGNGTGIAHQAETGGQTGRARRAAAELEMVVAQQPVAGDDPRA